MRIIAADYAWDTCRKNCCYCCLDLAKMEIFGQIILKYPNIKLGENVFWILKLLDTDCHTMQS